MSAAAARAGAADLLGLLRMIESATNEQLDASVDGEDGRDYVGLVPAVGHFVESSLAAAPAEREGFLRGLVDLMCMFVDGSTAALDDWDPLAASAPAFAAAQVLQRLGGVAQMSAVTRFARLQAPT